MITYRFGVSTCEGSEWVVCVNCQEYISLEDGDETFVRFFCAHAGCGGGLRHARGAISGAYRRWSLTPVEQLAVAGVDLGGEALRSAFLLAFHQGAV